MIKLSLTDLLDISSARGIKKERTIKKIKSREEYNPAHDFYKQLRQNIISFHKNNDGEDMDPQEILANVSNRKKLPHYFAALNGYTQWLNHENYRWFEPPRDMYNNNGVNVIINPELGLRSNEGGIIIKLYFKNDPLSKFGADAITHLMEIQLRPVIHENIRMAVLDMRRAKLYFYDEKAIVKQIIDAELALIANIWDLAA